MADFPLDNPFWSSLRTRHRRLAVGTDDVLRYPSEIAPFLGVASADVDAEAALASLVTADETMLVLGVAPKLSSAWRVQLLENLAQMICTQPVDVLDGPEIIELHEAHHANIQALTARVYPYYFRPRTVEMGRYFGFFREGLLAAMIGERLGSGAYTEMSAICTHPDFTGRGYARRLTAFLTNDTLARGRVPFLHVSHGNTHAKTLYERLGYSLRRNLPFWSLRRA